MDLEPNPQLQQLDLLAAFLGAENQTDGRAFALLSFVAIEPAELKLHLPLVPSLKLADFQFHRHQALEPAMEK